MVTEVVKRAAAFVSVCVCTLWLVASRPAGAQRMMHVRLGPSAGRNVSYLGCGCFWHVQHDVVTRVERAILGRSDEELTALTGYAGGTHTSQDGRVCYHSMTGVSDYGMLGHAEVVSLELPDGAAAQVAATFFEKTCVKGVRRDVQDRGAEYRSVVGFPGGIDSHAGKQFSAAAAARGIHVRTGAGNDGDVEGTVWVMDSARSPFYQAEVYHQFHADMVEQYSTAYYALRDALLGAGRIHRTGCSRD